MDNILFDSCIYDLNFKPLKSQIYVHKSDFLELYNREIFQLSKPKKHAERMKLIKLITV